MQERRERSRFHRPAAVAPCGALRTTRAVAVGAVAAILATGAALASKPPVQVIQATAEVPEKELLDVAIQVLRDGVPTNPAVNLAEEGIFPEVRRSEARYIPVHLMDTLQSTGHWGAVRVVPSGMDTVDVALSGKIVSSDGMRLVVDLKAVDAAGRVWFDKTYKELADARIYGLDVEAPRLRHDPFQNLYNRVANDLLAGRQKLDGEELRELRQISGIRFAAELVPAAFASYLEKNRKGLTDVSRLPSDADPMVARIAGIRERDYMFIDALTEHYTTFEAQMVEPYDNWRRFSYEETKAKKEVKRAARKRKILGAAAILGGILMQPDDSSEAAVRDAAIIAGTMAVRSGIAKGQEAKMHVEALRELGASFDAEVAPLLVDVEGQTLRLTGSVETQFEEWRKLLREIFYTETGLPIDPDTGAAVSSPES